MSIKRILWIAVVMITTTVFGQIILEPVVTGYVTREETIMHGHGHGSNSYYFHDVDIVPRQPDLRVGYNTWTTTWTYNDEWATWTHNHIRHAIMEMNVEQTAQGGEFPSANMTSQNFIALLCGLTVNDAAGVGRNMSARLWNLYDDREDGMIQADDYNSPNSFICTLFTQIPPPGQGFPEVDVTGELRHDLFGIGSGNPTSGFILIPSVESNVMGWAKFNHLNPVIEVYVNGQPTRTPRPTPTATMTRTPLPTRTPEPGTTATPTPDCPVLSPFLNLNQSIFYSGDVFLLECSFCNPGQARMVDLYILLEVDGRFWLWPDWSMNTRFQRFTARSCIERTIPVLEFTWPPDAGSAEGLIFWSGMLDPDSLDLIGIIDSVEWGFR